MPEDSGEREVRKDRGRVKEMGGNGNRERGAFWEGVREMYSPWPHLIGHLNN